MLDFIRLFQERKQGIKMTKEYNGEEKRSHVNAAMRILINVQEQTHTCVKKLGDDLSRNSAKTVANGVKLDTAISYNEKCDKRLTKVELWKAKHTGEGVGKAKLHDRINVKITLLCTIGMFIIAGLAFYYTSIKPTLDKNTAIVQKYQELLKN